MSRPARSPDIHPADGTQAFVALKRSIATLMRQAAFMLGLVFRKSITSSETAMAAGNKPSQVGAPQKRRHKFNPKRDPKPQVLAEANRTVLRMVCVVVSAFLLVIAVQAFW